MGQVDVSVSEETKKVIDRFKRSTYAEAEKAALCDVFALVAKQSGNGYIEDSTATSMMLVLAGYAELINALSENALIE